jgi:hypothetical protein
MKKLLLLTLTHLLMLGAGFAGGIYLLPILIAPPAPTGTELKAAASGATFKGRFQRDLNDSDMLHWGAGEVSVGPPRITLQGRLAPGPDYKLYLSPTFVETEADFVKHKPVMQRVGDVKTFDGFVVPVPEGIDIQRHTTVIVWCETFGQFISAARYRS